MKALYNILKRRSIRLGQWLSLIFFVCMFAQSCRQKEGDGITLLWKGKQAIGIAIDKNTLQNEPIDFVLQQVQVRLANSTTAILGELTVKESYIEFKPVVPFSKGMQYEVFLRKQLLGRISIPVADSADAPYIVDIFPAMDTLPENLLKIYVQFSLPMREGEALKHIQLLDGNQHTIPNTFLDLQPELWNAERTILTVWLDPGRIKRDLIPNQQMGNPLQKGKRYILFVSNKWQDVQNLPLRQSFTRQFIVGSRDSISPQPEQWLLKLPAAKTTEGLGIKFSESLDYFLISETIKITDEKGNFITGKAGALSNGTGFAFRPEKPWQPGRYRLQVATYLEDLAGNNLNRLFDRDIRLQKTREGKDFFERTFVVK